MAAQNQNKVSLPVIKRLPKYYRYISDMHNNGIVKVSSSELARMMGTTASQVRQDFNCFGGSVKRISTQCSSVQAVWAAPYPAIFPPRPGAIT